MGRARSMLNCPGLEQNFWVEEVAIEFYLINMSPTSTLVDRLNDRALEFEFCEHYIYEKHNHVQFYSSSHKSAGLLDLIHLDVFGPVKVPSISKAQYYVPFIDDYSRRTWVYFLRSKPNVFNQFKEFKALLKNEIGRLRC